jgi:predicted AAA+ superfamily ATPase
MGGSWEGFVLSNILSVCPAHVLPFFYRTASGDEIDLILEVAGTIRWAVEIKRNTVPVLSGGYYRACSDIGVSERFVIHGGSIAYSLPDGVQALPVSDFMQRLLAV